MTGETGMSLAVVGRKRQTVQTARRLALAECTRKWRLRQEMSDGQLLTSGLWRVQLQRERQANQGVYIEIRQRSIQFLVATSHSIPCMIAHTKAL